MALAGAAVAAFAAASVKAARDYDVAFTKIAAISNASAEDIAQWRDQVITLAGETAQAPTELADALYFLSSAGLKANEVMPALQRSAQASAIGLGETADVANIVASALNAYSKSGLTAAEATDTLVAAVREGRAEPEEFATALGRILPIASTVGVTFDQVAASMAALSNIGLDVNEGVTAMRGVLQAIAAPGTQAADAMNQLGLSAQDLLDAISEDGIIGALRLLDQAAKKQTDTQAAYNGILRKIVPNVRALTGVFGLTVQEASKVDAIFDNVENSTGALNDAFEKTQESLSFRFAKALNDIMIAGQELATVVFPLIVESAEEVAGSIADIFGPVEDFLDLLPEIGTGSDSAGFSVGGLIEGLQTLANPLEAVRHPIGRFQEAWREATGQIERTTGAMDLNATAAAWNGTQANRLRARYAESKSVYGSAADALHGVARGHNDAAEAARSQRRAELALIDPLFAVLDSADQLQSAQQEVNRLRRHGKQDTEAYRDAVLQELEATLAAKNDLRDYARGLDEAGTSHRRVVRQVQALGAEMHLTKGDIRGVIDELNLIPGSVRVTVKAETGPALTDIAKIQDHVNTLVAHDYEIRVHAKEVSESPIPSVLIEQLTKALDTLTGTDWEIEIHALGTGELDQLKAYRRDLEGLGKQFDQLKDKANEFRKAIRSGFATFADLAGGIGSALSDFANEQQAYAEAQAEYAKELRDYQNLAFAERRLQAPPAVPVAPTAVDLSAFLEQQVAAASAFADSLKRLQREGLSTANIRQIAEMGPAGQAVANALLANTDLIEQMNQTQRTIADVTQATAEKLTTAAFGRKIERLGNDLDDMIRNLRRFINHIPVPELNDKTRDFLKAIDRLTNAMNSASGGKNAPHAQTGGWVAESGLAVIHRGEQILPDGAGGGITINVNGDVTGQDVVDKIERELTARLQRHGAILNGAVRT
jgi:TP901 family phage tail tape measure protein